MMASLRRIIIVLVAIQLSQSCTRVNATTGRFVIDPLQESWQQLDDATPNTRRCFDAQESPVLGGCNGSGNSDNNSNNTLSINYTQSFGMVTCGRAYTRAQTRTGPIVTWPAAIPSAYYTILLIDTSDTAQHPILHYGAVNVPGSVLQVGFDTNTSPSSSTTTSSSSALQFSFRSVTTYRGPSPPRFLRLFRSVRKRLFNYEWLVVWQKGNGMNGTNGKVDDSIPVERTSRLNFDYRTFLNQAMMGSSGKNATTTSTTAMAASIVQTSYFRSGFCVATRN